MNLGKGLLDQKQCVFGPEALAKQLFRLQVRATWVRDRGQICDCTCRLRALPATALLHLPYIPPNSTLYILLLSAIEPCSRVILTEKVHRQPRLPRTKHQKVAVVGDAKRRRGAKRRQERSRRRVRLV